MSRFIEALNEYRGEVTFMTLPRLVGDLRQRLAAPSAEVEVRFPYLVEKREPVTDAVGRMDFDCWFRANGADAGDTPHMGIKVPVTSLCPCSKAISDYGAHNQGGYVTIEVRPTKDHEGEVALLWFEELMQIAEDAASCPVYPILKRQDERHVTMQAYGKPAFVEDINHAAFAEAQWHR